MADWRVSKEIVEVKEHPNADKLDVLKVGEYQMVSGKGNYQTGDEVIIIPKDSVIPPGPIRDEYEKYLTGPEQNRVKAVRLRGEYSEAITWPVDNLGHIDQLCEYNIEKVPVGEDISECLGVTKYEPPIPYNMQGEVESFNLEARKHDVYQYASYADEISGQVIITEKVHGSQINYFLESDGTESISSKGLLKRGLRIKESEKNVYWQAAINSDLKSVAEDCCGDKIVQLIGEVIPVQKGFTYGQETKVVLLFDVLVDGKSVPYEKLPKLAAQLWVPVLHMGTVDEVDLQKLSKGKEQVSGQELHIREGIVVKSVNEDRAEDGTRLILKVINPKYKESGEEFN